MLPRRAPYALPFADQLPTLAAILDERRAVAPDDPARFAEAATHHNLLGFVLDAVRAGGLELPEELVRGLGDTHLRRTARVGLLRRELEAIEPVLHDACGATPIVVKGPAVADRFYPDRRLRPYADLDLMLPRDRLGEGVAALRGRGFSVIEELRPGYAERFGHDVHVSRGSGAARVDLELHWRIGDDAVGTPLGHARLAERAVRLPIGESHVLVPSVGDQLLLLAVHLLGDRARRLAWVNDVRLVARAADPREWDGAFATAHAIGGGLPWVLHRALDQAEHHLGLDRRRPLPAGPPPAYGPLRAVDELDIQASPHIGRLVALRGRERLAYLRAVALPTRAGLEGTVGGDGAGMPRLVLRHLGRTARGLIRPRRP